MVEFGIIANPTKSGICSQIRVKIIELYGMTPELNKTLHNFFSSGNAKSNVIFCACDNEKLVASAGAKRYKNRIALPWIFVEKEYQRQGIGTTLIKKIRGYYRNPFLYLLLYNYKRLEGTFPFASKQHLIVIPYDRFHNPKPKKFL